MPTYRPPRCAVAGGRVRARARARLRENIGTPLAERRFAERPAFSHPDFDHEARIVVADMPDWTVASIYVPNGGKDFEAKLRFLDGLERYVSAARARGQQLLLCGDLNIAREDRDVHPSLRKPNQIGRTPEEQSQFARMLEAGDLTDLSRKFAPDDDRLFSWWAPWRNLREKNVGWRIDYILASEPLTAAAVSCDVQRDFGKSDHGPLIAQFQLFDDDDARARASVSIEAVPRVP